MTWRVVPALAAVAAIGVGAFLLATGRESEPPGLPAEELSAEGLVDSIGVNVHFSYVDTAYVRRDDVLARLRELGVRHVRDAMPNPVEALRAGLLAARGQGIRATLLADPAREPGPAVADSLAVVGDAVDAFEGPNELDNVGDPGWAATLRSYMPKLADAVRSQAPGVPLIGPSIVNPSNRAELPANLPGLLNAHPYPEGGPPEPRFGEALDELKGGPVEKGVVFTETGYHNALEATTGQPPVSEQAAGVYLPRALVTAFGAGVDRTFVYELLDEKPDPGLLDPEQHFGLLRQDLSPKPAFTAIQTLIAALRTAPGGGERGSMSWKLRIHGDGQVERLALTRRDGSRVLALWRPVSVWDQSARRAIQPAPLPVELRFGLGVRDLSVWRPSISTQPVLRRRYARRLPLRLEGDLVLVSFR